MSKAPGLTLARSEMRSTAQISGGEIVVELLLTSLEGDTQVKRTTELCISRKRYAGFGRSSAHDGSFPGSRLACYFGVAFSVFPRWLRNGKFDWKLGDSGGEVFKLSDELAVCAC